MNTIITPAPAYQKPSGKLYLASTQLDLVNGIWTKVLLETIGANFTDGIEDTVNHRITPGRGGFYDIKGQVTFTNIVTPRLYIAALKISGTDLICINDGSASAGDHYSVPVGHLIKLSVTDYIELHAMSVSGDNTVDVRAGSAYTFLSIQRVR